MAEIASLLAPGWTALKRMAGWPLRVVAARRVTRLLAAMSDCELRDIGLSRQDVHDATALPLGADPGDHFRLRADERRLGAKPMPPATERPTGHKAPIIRLVRRDRSGSSLLGLR